MSLTKNGESDVERGTKKTTEAKEESAEKTATPIVEAIDEMNKTIEKFDKSSSNSARKMLCINIITLFTLIVTTVFVIKYWKETQIMKEQMINQTKEMVEQTKISSDTLKASLLPLLDVSIKFVSPFTANFAYDIYLHNKGNGPAFNITVIQGITKRNHLSPPLLGDIKPFSKRISIIGKDEKIRVHTEHSDSHDYFKIKVMYRNLFGDLQHCTFEGSRKGLKLKEHPMLKHFQND